MPLLMTVGSHSRSLCLFFLIAPALAVPSFAQSPIDNEEQIMVGMINEYRAQKGLGKLSISISLTRAAEWMSTDMSTRNYFGHNDSLGRDPFARMIAFGYTYPTTKGENLAAGYIDAARTFNQWKNSPSHNTAMLNGAFKVIGISRVYGQSSLYKWYWSTDFGGYIDAIFDGNSASMGQNVKTVNSANYFQTIAPDAIATTFLCFRSRLSTVPSAVE
jgi:uncharacterized protein YkwD